MFGAGYVIVPWLEKSHTIGNQMNGLKYELKGYF